MLIFQRLTSQRKMPLTGHFSLAGSVSLVAALLFLGSWLTPLHVLPWVSWHNELLSFAAVLLLAWYGLARRATDASTIFFAIPYASLPFLILVAVLVVQWATGSIAFSGDAAVLMLYVALCILCLHLGFAASHQGTAFSSAKQKLHGGTVLTLVAVTLLFGAFVSAVVALAQVFELWEDSQWINRMPLVRRPGGNLGQANQLGSLLLMGIASLLFLYGTGRLKIASASLIFFTLCMALAASQSRTAVLSFLLMAVWWLVKRPQIEFRISRWAVALACVLLLTLFWSWPRFMEVNQGAQIGILAEVDTSAGTRLVVWPQLLEAISQRPWWGWGLREVPAAHNAVVHAYSVSEPFSYSHNIVLDLAVGMGVPLAVLFVGLTLVWLWRRIRVANQLLPWYCVAVALPVAVHSMLEFPFAYAYFLAPVMLALGALEGMTAGKPLVRIGVRPAATLLLGLSILAAWSVVEYVLIEEDFRVARFEAVRLGETPVEYERPRVILLTQLGALLESARMSPKPGMTDEELMLARKVALRYPWTASQNRYALSLALNGDPKEAVRQLQVMRTMHGEVAYEKLKMSWNELARDRYPQLLELKLP